MPPPHYILLVVRLIFLEQRKNPKQHNGTYRAHQKLAPENTASLQAEQTENPATQQATDDTDDDANQEAHASFHDFSSDEACQGPD